MSGDPGVSADSAPRLASHMLVAALCRRVQAEGGFASVIHRGDAHAGAILIECADRGQRQILVERATDLDGREHWRPAGGNVDMTDETYSAWLDKRRRSDPDLWVIELDIADAARFAAEALG